MSKEYERGWYACAAHAEANIVAQKLKNDARRVGHQRHELKMLNRLLAWERQEHKKAYDSLRNLADALADANWKFLTDRQEAQTKIDKLRTLSSVAPDGLLDVRVLLEILDS